MVRSHGPLSFASQSGLSTQGALGALGIAMLSLVFGGFAVIKLVSSFEGPEASLEAQPLASSPCISRVVQIGSEVYDPKLVSCKIAQGPSALWSVQAKWREGEPIADLAAAWMGPGSLQKRPDGTEFCPELTGVEQVLFARTFRNAQAERARIETLVDEGGRIIVEHLESGRVLFERKLNSKRFARSLTLPRGRIRILIEAVDSDTATGALFSMRGADRRPLVLSGDEGWCLFRLAADTTLVSLLKEHAACHACLGAETHENP